MIERDIAGAGGVGRGQAAGENAAAALGYASRAGQIDSRAGAGCATRATGGIDALHAQQTARRFEVHQCGVAACDGGIAARRNHATAERDISSAGDIDGTRVATGGDTGAAAAVDARGSDCAAGCNDADRTAVRACAGTVVKALCRNGTHDDVIGSQRTDVDGAGVHTGGCAAGVDGADVDGSPRHAQPSHQRIGCAHIAQRHRPRCRSAVGIDGEGAVTGRRIRVDGVASTKIHCAAGGRSVASNDADIGSHEGVAGVGQIDCAARGVDVAAQSDAGGRHVQAARGRIDSTKNNPVDVIQRYRICIDHCDRAEIVGL